MKLNEQEKKYIASLEKVHRLRWWCGLAILPVLLFVIVYGQRTLQSFMPSTESSTDYFDWHLYIMTATYWWPAILFHCALFGAILGYLIVRWRPDPAKLLLVKIAKDLDESEEQEPGPTVR